MGRCKSNRLGEEKYNNQGCLMRIVEYNGALDIVVEFQDEYKIKVNTQYWQFKLGEVKNPYYPSIYGVGVIGTKYPLKVNGKNTKEYESWKSVLERSFDEKLKNKYITYKSIDCCREWLNYENFYEWLHAQENFEKWLSGDRWEIDKDILIKGNKIYSPETCCLVPHNVNSLFAKSNATRGDLPIGVTRHGIGFQARCSNPLNDNGYEYLGTYSIPNQAFLAYKRFKEDLIRQIAQIEYDKNNITKQCYEAMINYKVETTD